MLRSFRFYQVILVFDQRVPAVRHWFRQSPKLRVPAEMLGLFRMWKGNRMSLACVLSQLSARPTISSLIQNRTLGLNFSVVNDLNLLYFLSQRSNLILNKPPPRCWLSKLSQMTSHRLVIIFPCPFSKILNPHYFSSTHRVALCTNKFYPLSFVLLSNSGGINI